MGTVALAHRSIRTDATDTAWIHFVGDWWPGSICARRRPVFDRFGRGASPERGDASPRVDRAISFRPSTAPICARLVRAEGPRIRARLALRSRPGIVFT